ncbi:MAG: M48 family metalloprotease [Capsulimonadaceae bacterium]
MDNTLHSAHRASQLGFRMALLFLACGLMFGVVGALIGLACQDPMLGFVIGVCVGTFYCAIASWGTDRFALDIYDAEVIAKNAAPNLYKTVAKLSAAVGIDPPILYLLPYGAPNAYAIARVNRESVIVLTQLVVTELHTDEVRALMALMIARLSRPDAGAATLGATLAGLPIHVLTAPAFRKAVGKIGHMDPRTGFTGLEKLLLTLASAPGVALARLAFDRASHAAADTQAANLIGSSELLAAALTVIDAEKPDVWFGETPYNPATAILFAVPPLADPATLDTCGRWAVGMQAKFMSWIPDVYARRNAIPEVGTALVPELDLPGMFDVE